MRRTDHLTPEDMEGLGAYLAMDSAERHGHRGFRQKPPMVGMFVTWGDVHQRRFRGSDFSLRVALLVHGWHKTGLPIQRAAEKVAEEYGPFLRLHLGKGRRGKRSYGGVTELDETVRTVYYKFLERCPAIDVWLEMWFWNYVHWFDWVSRVDERVIELAVRDYQELDRPESAEAFRAFADKVRRNPNRWHPSGGWSYRRIPLSRGDDISANVAASSNSL